jgi:hypothetical protein
LGLSGELVFEKPRLVSGLGVLKGTSPRAPQLHRLCWRGTVDLPDRLGCR